MREDLQLRATDAVEIARAAGADDAFASASRSRSVEFAWRAGRAERVQESTSQSLTIRVYKDGRYSAHRTNDLRADALHRFVADAVELTSALQADPHRMLPDPELYGGRAEASLELVDDQVAGLTREQRFAWCRELADRAGADERVLSCESGCSTDENENAVASTNGLTGAHAGTSTWFGCSVTVRDGPDKRPEGGMWAGARHLADLPDPQTVADEALRRTLEKLGTQKGPTLKTTMVVAPWAARSLVARLLGPANARSVYQGRSVFAERVGQAVASSRLTIKDEPHLARGFGSRHFDSEGLASRTLSVVNAGVLENLYVDTYYGRKAGLTPTTGSSSNRVVGLGSRDQAAIVADLAEGILVTEWLGGNADSTTGDFSLGTRGRMIRAGQLAEPVGEMNVTGNLLDLFQGLAEVGNDPWRYSSTLTPTMAFEGVQFSGA
ncbi:MAG: PmbA protein [Myxococcota bacterium]|jgi:PmbA protein